MAKSDTLHLRIDPKVKADVESTLRPLGLSTADAVNIFLHQVILTGGLPFAVRLPEPNAETRAAIEDADARRNLSGPYHSAAELKEALDA